MGGKMGGKPPSKPPASTKKWGNMFPQFERWYIESVNPTGTYNLVNKDSSNRMRGVVNISPRPGIIEVGQIANVGFYDCDRQKPYIWSTGTALLSTPPVPAELTYNWYCYLSDFERKSAWTGSTFDIESMGTFYNLQGTGGLALPRWQDNYFSTTASTFIRIPQVDGSAIETYEEWDFAGTEAIEAMKVAAGIEGFEVTIISSEAKSLCIVGDFVYLHVKYETEISEVLEPYHIVFLFNAIPPEYEDEFEYDEFRIQIVAAKHLYKMVEDTDFIVEWGRAGYIGSIYDAFAGTYEWFYRHWDTELIGEEQFDIPAFDYVSYEASIIPETWIPYGVTVFTFARDSRIYFGGRGVPIQCIDISTNELVWRLSSTGRVYSPIGMTQTSLICAYEEEDLEIVTDYPMHVDYWYADITDSIYEEYRVETSAGHSHRAGIVAISLASGAEVGETEFAGSEDNGDFADSWHDYNADFDEGYWPARTNAWHVSGAEYRPDWAYTGWGGIWFPLLHDFYIVPTDAAYQATNESGTFIEGEATTPGEYGDFQGMYDELFLDFNGATIEGPSRDTFSIGGTTYDGGTANERDWNEQCAIDANARINFSPGDTGDVQQGVVAVEATKLGVNDRISADMLKTTCEQTQLFDASTISTIIPGEVQSLTALVIHLSNPIHGDGSLVTPTVRYGNAFGKIPSTTPPDNISVDTSDMYTNASVTFNRVPWFMEYYEWYKSWDGVSDSPWEGMDTINAWAVQNGGGFATERRVIWRSTSELTPRTRTPVPHVNLGRSCSTGDLVIVGPRHQYYTPDTIIPMVWQAYNSSGAMVWETSIDKGQNVIPGNPILVGLDGAGLSGVFQVYYKDTDYYLIVLDAATGEVLYDEISPFVSEYILFDGYTVWQQDGDVGLSTL